MRKSLQACSWACRRPWRRRMVVTRTRAASSTPCYVIDSVLSSCCPGPRHRPSRPRRTVCPAYNLVPHSFNHSPHFSLCFTHLKPCGTCSLAAGRTNRNITGRRTPDALGPRSTRASQHTTPISPLPTRAAQRGDHFGNRLSLIIDMPRRKALSGPLRTRPRCNFHSTMGSKLPWVGC